MTNVHCINKFSDCHIILAEVKGKMKPPSSVTPLRAFAWQLIKNRSSGDKDSKPNFMVLLGVEN